MANSMETLPNMPDEKGIDLSTETLLVRLVITQFGNTANSATITREAADAHHADVESVKGIIYKLRKADRMTVTAPAGRGRAVFYAHTLPWDDKGFRICPAVVYERLRSELTKVETEFTAAAEALCERRDELEVDFKARLNDLETDVEFPTAEQMRTAFKFELKEMPLTDPTDFRLHHVSTAHMQQIQEGLRAQMEVKLRNAQHDIIRRLTDLVANVAEECGKDKVRIYDTLIGNLVRAVDILPALNITEDREINRLIGRVRDELTSIQTDELREDAGARHTAQQRANSILHDLRNFRPGG